MLKQLGTGLVLVSLTFCSGTSPKNTQPRREISQSWKDYWYNGFAELTSYSIKQARYGEIHEGNVVLVFVAEPFSVKEMVKTDRPSASDISVMKLNYTKKFHTGIYPYSMMTSSFTPIKLVDHAFKVSSSSQEWCGHTFVNMERLSGWNWQLYSYFQSEGKQTKTFESAWVEDELFSRIRLNPEELPIGAVNIIPSAFYLRLSHNETNVQKAIASKKQVGNETTYSLFYPEHKRTLEIRFENKLPFQILAWKETYLDGFGRPVELTTEAVRNKQIRLDYWNKHTVQDSIYRKMLE